MEVHDEAKEEEPKTVRIEHLRLEAKQVKAEAEVVGGGEEV